MTAATATVHPHTAAPQRPRLRILFFAARPATVGALRQTLQRDADIDLHLAVDLQEAEAIAARMQFDLILIDLPWAGRTGENLVARLRGRGNNARVAVLGDLSGKRAREAARRIGANGFTPDPASPDLFKVVFALARPEAVRRVRRPAAPQREGALAAA